MKAILLIVLLHSAIGQQSEEEADRPVSRFEARIQQLEQAVQLAAQHSPGMENRIKFSAMLGDRMSAMEGRMTAQIASIMELMTSQSSTVRDFNQLYLELRDQDARVMESQLVEMRQIVQSAVDHLSATEERIATANAAMEDRLISNHAVLSENLTSLMTNFTEHLTAEMGDRINDLENRTRVEVSCKELRSRGHLMNGVYTIRSPDTGDARVYCDMLTDGGGWQVFQRRNDGSQDFFRNWAEYAAGFGDLNGEFWLGNRNLHALTANQPHELRIDLKDNGEAAFAKYSTFNVGPESGKFRLAIGGYSGDAGDNMAYHNGMQFSAKDQDHDAWSGANCANERKGGWWYNECHKANLNGIYLNGAYTGDKRGIDWYGWKGVRYSIQFTEMKIRPIA